MQLFLGQKSLTTAYWLKNQNLFVEKPAKEMGDVKKKTVKNGNAI